MAFRLAMGKFSHLSERRGRDDDDDDDDDFNRLPRKGLGNVPPHLSVKFYRGRMDITSGNGREKGPKDDNI